MDNKNSQNLFLLYATIKEETSESANMMFVNKSIHVLHTIETINSYTS